MTYMSEYLSWRTREAYRPPIQQTKRRHEWQLGRLLWIANVKQMPVVETFILEDMRRRDRELLPREKRARATRREIRLTARTPLQREQEVKMRQEKQKMAIEVSPQVEAMVPVLATVETVPQDIEVVNKLRWEAARTSIEQLVASRSRESSVLVNMVAATDSKDAASHLAGVWDTFAAYADLEHSRQELNLALDFLFYLSTPSSNSPLSDVTPFLPLSLDILDDLLDTALSDEDVGTRPSYPSLTDDSFPQAVIVQTILLRTIVKVASATENLALVQASFEALSQLRITYAQPDIPRALDEDRSLLHSTLSTVLGNLSVDRQFTYLRTDSLPPPSLEVAQSLLTLLSQWTPLVLDDSSKPFLDYSTVQLVESFIDEAAARERWDLVAATWELWGGVDGSTDRGFQLHDHHVKLLRWYGGDAPFRVYGIVSPSSSLSTHSTRLCQPALFDALSIATTSQLPSLAQRWSTTQRASYIHLLCSSRASSRTSSNHARSAYTLFTRLAPPGSPTPFILPSPAILALARTSVQVTGRPNTFIDTLSRDYISHLTSPTSPFRISRTMQLATLTHEVQLRIPHYALTTLAQLYSLTGDFRSLAQVYRRMMAQKMLPDGKDVRLVLASAPRRDSKSWERFVTTAQEMGIELRGIEVWKEVWRGKKLELEEREKEKGGVDWVMERRHFLAFAMERGVKKQARDELRLFVIAYEEGNSSIGGGEEEEGGKKPVAAVKEPTLRGVMRAYDAAVAQNNWTLATNIYVKAVEQGLRHEPFLEHIIADLLAFVDPKRNSRPQAHLKDVVRSHLVDVVEISIEKNVVQWDQKALDAVYRAVIKVGDFGALEKVVKVFERSLSPGEKTKEVVRRWAVGKVGREKVGEMGGWISELVPKKGNFD